MDKVRSLIELAKLSASRHDERRNYEWKVSFAFWALLIGAVVKNQQLGFKVVPIWLCILIGILYAFGWLRGVWVANENDKRLSDHFRNEAVHKLKNVNYMLLQPPEKISALSCEYWLGFICNWAMFFHLCVTAVLIVVYCLMPGALQHTSPYCCSAGAL